MERLKFGEVTIAVTATAESTDGALGVIEELPPLVDTPAHVHANEDELFYVLEGEHIVRVGERGEAARPGRFALWAPRGVPHAQRRVVPGEGRMLIAFLPGGFEGFFRELAEAEQAGKLDPEAYAAASERFGITWL